MRKPTAKQGILLLSAALSAVVVSRLINYTLHTRVTRAQQYVEDFKKLQYEAQLTVGPTFMKWWDTEIVPTLTAEPDDADLWGKAFFLAVHAHLHEQEQELFRTLRAVLSPLAYEQNMRMHQTEMDALRATMTRHGVDLVKLDTQFAMA